MQALKGLMGVLGRTMLCAVFIAAALGYGVPNANQVAQALASKWTLPSTWLLGGSMICLVFGCFSVIVGYKARMGAALLLAFLVLATVCLHGFTFWTIVSAEARQTRLLHLVTNLSIVGAMLFIVANGAGQASVDAKRR